MGCGISYRAVLYDVWMDYDHPPVEKQVGGSKAEVYKDVIVMNDVVVEGRTLYLKGNYPLVVHVNNLLILAGGKENLILRIVDDKVRFCDALWVGPSSKLLEQCVEGPQLQKILSKACDR